ncbi:MAG: hypothetical protein LBF97_00900 [Elusimicrobiota bacterium]|jgi:hypothetical protein|nr:hypothetical protein [Elusimicrobiota bacterium]
MKIDTKKLNDFILYSNSNIEKTIRSVVNESDNASVVALYEDKCILLDYKKGEFYNASYAFNPKTGIIIFEDFEEIEIENSEDSLKESIRNYFNSDNDPENIEAIKEAFEDSITNNENFIKSIVSESIKGKNFSEIIDYSILENINEEVKEIQSLPFYKAYKDRIEKKPMTSIKHFDWKNKVQVSLIENESNKIINKSVKAKAENLSKDPDFKNALIEAFNDLSKGNEELAIALIEEYPGLFLLDKAERKTVIGKSLLSNTSLLENRTKLIKEFEKIFEESENLADVRDLIFEATDEISGVNTTGAAPSIDTNKEDDDEDKKDKANEEEEPAELSDKEIEAVIKALQKASEKVEDSGNVKLADKIEKLEGEVEKMKEVGTSADVVKEAIEILSM